MLNASMSMKMMVKKQAMYGYQFHGTRYDIGNKLDYLKTIVDYGLKRKDFRDPFYEFLKSRIKDFEKNK